MPLIEHFDFEDNPQFDDFRTQPWGAHAGGLEIGLTRQDIMWNCDENGVYSRPPVGGPRTGSKCGFMVLDPQNTLGDGAHPQRNGNGGYRTEYHMNNSGDNGLISNAPTTWWGASYQFPTNWDLGNPGDTSSRTLWQLHRGPGGGGSPQWALRVNGSETQIQFTSENCNSNTTVRWFNDLDIMVGKWMDWVISITHSQNPAVGRARLWINGVLEFDQNMQTVWCDDSIVGYNKYGIYHQSGILYIDELRMGSSAVGTTLEDMIIDTVPNNPSAALTGTVVPSALESEIVAGGETLTITLTDDEWVDA